MLIAEANPWGHQEGHPGEICLYLIVNQWTQELEAEPNHKKEASDGARIRSPI